MGWIKAGYWPFMGLIKARYRPGIGLIQAGTNRPFSRNGYAMQNECELAYQAIMNLTSSLRRPCFARNISDVVRVNFFQFAKV